MAHRSASCRDLFALTQSKTQCRQGQEFQLQELPWTAFGLGDTMPHKYSTVSTLSSLRADQGVYICFYITKASYSRKLVARDSKRIPPQKWLIGAAPSPQTRSCVRARFNSSFPTLATTRTLVMPLTRTDALRGVPCLELYSPGNSHPSFCL